MNKQDMIEFFNESANTWDERIVRNHSVIEKILDYAGVEQGMSILDVACGTGVLIPYYLKRNVKSITGVDISKQMIECARKKFCDSRVTFLCDDIETVELKQQFDCCVLYNAFPHFYHPEKMIQAISLHMVEGGRFSIAHSMSRERINHHHSKAASKVSVGLLEADEVAKLMGPYFKVDVVISNDEMYQVSGVK